MLGKEALYIYISNFTEGMEPGLPVTGNKRSSLATLFYFQKHKLYFANSVIIISVNLKVLDIFHLGP